MNENIIRSWLFELLAKLETIEADGEKSEHGNIVTITITFKKSKK
jgi:hypothetical protein